MKKVKQEVIKKLKGLKKFSVSFIDEVNKTIEIEATDEDEARKIFFKGDWNSDDEEEGDINLVEDSVEVQEVEE